MTVKLIPKNKKIKRIKNIYKNTEKKVSTSIGHCSQTKHFP